MARTGTGKHEPVVTNLRERIGSGDLGPGDWLPSETQLMDEFGVNRYYAREAIKQLAAEGLIVVVHGRGSHVRARPYRARHSDPRGLLDTAAASGGDGWRDAEYDQWSPAEEPAAYRVDAGVDLALTLGIPEHTPLFGVDRLLERPTGHSTGHGTGPGAGSGAGVRRMLHRLYVPMAAATRVPRLADDPFPTPGGLYAALNTAGITVTLTEHVRAVTAAPDDSASLNLTPGAPVLITRRIVRDVTGFAVAMEETRRSGDDTQLTYTITPHSERAMP